MTIRRSRRGDIHRPLAAPLATRLARCGLWTLVACGALGGLVAAFRPGTLVVKQESHVAETEPSGLGGVAEMAIRGWLLDEGRPGRGENVALTVDAVSTVATRRIVSGYWAVTVAASVRPADGEATTVWFLEVGITDSGQGPRPVGRPAIVPAPISLAPLEPTPLTLTVPPADDPIASTAEAFLRSLLTGDGDPTRYVAPNADISPIEASPFTEVRLERIAVAVAEPAFRRVRVAIHASRADRIIFELFYELTLAERDGRWEVTALSGAPTLPSRRSQPLSTTPRPAPEKVVPAVPSPGA